MEEVAPGVRSLADLDDVQADKLTWTYVEMIGAGREL